MMYNKDKKGRLYVKKILLEAIALLSAVTVTGSVCFAASPSVKFEMGSKNISYLYNADSDEETVTEANKLFDLSSLKAGKTKSDELKITSVSKSNGKIAVSLRLEIEQADPEAQASVLDYYDFIITDSKGETIYSSAETQPSEIDALEKEIPLGVFNTQFTTDTKTYNIEYGINENTAALVEAVKAKTLKIKTVTAKADEEQLATEVPEENAEPTLKPKFELETGTNPTAQPSASPAPSETADPNASEEPKEKKEVKKVCGKDIDPGRYIVSGNGIVKITGEDGKLKSETTVTDGKQTDVKGTEGFITNLDKGDVITVVPLEGMEKATVAFEKTNTSSANKNTVSNTAGKTTNTLNTTVPNTKVSTKTNPKTGDIGLTLGVLSAFMGVSAASFAGLGILKKKKK